MVNNEFCYSDRGAAQTAKGYCFRASPDTVSRLDEMGVDIVSIANNHAYDYGEEAFIDTIETLNNAGMPYVGGGMNIEDAISHVIYFRINDMKIVGGHSHRLQGVEYYKNVPIFYSMSNFSFSSRVIDSCILNVQVDKNGIRQAKYIPCMENAGTTIQCEDGDSNYTRIISTLNKISANAKIDDSGVVSEKDGED